MAISDDFASGSFSANWTKPADIEIGDLKFYGPYNGPFGTGYYWLSGAGSIGNGYGFARYYSGSGWGAAQKSSIIFYTTGVGNGPGLIVRAQSDSATYYRADFASGNCRLCRVVNHIATELTTAAHGTLTAGARTELEIDTGHNLTVYHNGSALTGLTNIAGGGGAELAAGSPGIFSMFDDSNGYNWFARWQGTGEVLAAPSPSVSEDVTLTETVTLTYGADLPNVSSAVTITDTPTVVLTGIPTALDSITITESSSLTLSSVETITKLASEAITVSDSPTVILPVLKVSVSESITVTDTVTDAGTRGTIYPSVSDAITVTDSLPTDHVDLFPSWIGPGEDVTVTETVHVSFKSYINLTETVNLIENTGANISPTLSIPLFVSEAVTITETAVEFFGGWSVWVTTAITVDDVPSVNVLNAGTILPAVEDTITLTETVTPLLTALKPEASDSITVSDTPTLETVKMIEIQTTEAVTITESPAGFLTPLRMLATDAITLAEDIDHTLSGSRFIDVADSVIVIETLTFPTGGLLLMRRRRRA
jgi:hypothetical protein